MKFEQYVWVVTQEGETDLVRATLLPLAPSVGLGRTEGLCCGEPVLSCCNFLRTTLATIKNVQMQNSHSAYYSLSSKGSVGFQRVPSLILKCRCS